MRAENRIRSWLKPLWIFLAIVFLIEAWLWDHLEPIVARIVAVIPWQRLKVLLARSIDRLSPAGTLVVFLVPIAVIIPIKVIGLWLVAEGYWVHAAGILLLAKLAGLGTTAFVFDACRDKLLQLVWFRLLYESVIALRDWAHGMVDPIMQKIRRLVWLSRPQRAGRFFRRIARLRRQVHRPEPAASAPTDSDSRARAVR
jgi:hypothetical protein